MIPRQGVLKTRDLDQCRSYGVCTPSEYTILCANVGQTHINNFRWLYRQTGPISVPHDCWAAWQRNWTYFCLPQLVSQSIITSIIDFQSQKYTLIDWIPRQGGLKTRDLDQCYPYGGFAPSEYTILCPNVGQTRISNFRRLYRQTGPISVSHDCCLSQL